MERNLSELYQAVIRQHDRSPYHYEVLPTATHQAEAYNPLCGDQFQLFLTIEAGVIVAASFQGYGCAISKASTSVLMKNLQGLPMAEVSALLQHFQELVSGTTDSSDEALQAFAAARQFPERLSCTTLSWDALAQLLERL